jgi:hypothetical protein
MNQITPSLGYNRIKFLGTQINSSIIVRITKVVILLARKSKCFRRPSAELLKKAVCITKGRQNMAAALGSYP